MLQLSKKLKEHRKELRISQSALAQAASISLATLQNIEAGKANPSFKTLETLFNALGLTVEIKAQRLDLSRWISYGLPLLETENDKSFQPTREKFLRDFSLIKKSQLSRASLSDRELKSLVSFFSALNDHYPSLGKKNKSVLEWLQKNNSLISPKLRRISLQNMAIYL